MVPEVTIFNTAWLIEKDLSEFYEKMARQTTGKAKKSPYLPVQMGKGTREILPRVPGPVLRGLLQNGMGRVKQRSA